MKLIGRIEPVMHLQGRLNAIPGGVYAPGDEADIEYIVRDENGVVVPSELVEEESNARTKILQLLESLGGSLTDEEIAEIEAEVDALLNETDPAELGNLSGFSIVNKIRLAQTYRDDVVSAMEAKGVVPEENQPFRTVADLVEQFNLQEKTVVPSAVQQIINPDDGYFGLKPVIVEAANLVENLPQAEAFAFGADLTLPVIPADVLASYPKAVIFQVTSATSAQFVYIAAKSAFYRVTGSLIGMEYDEVVGSLGEGVKASSSSGAWGDQIPAAVGTAGLMVGTEGNNTYSLVWANHDIYEVLAVDTTTGKITTGAVYFAASADVVTGTAEEYRIQKESIDGIGEQVNRLCNTVEPMPPDRMEEKLSNLDITLQDIVITATDEEQIIKPEGHYGFYKITVEAVESSGTGGGGTPGEGGGEGDDEPEIKYPSFEDSELVYEATTAEVPTGRYFYGKYPTSLPACPYTYPYQHMYSGSKLRINQTSIPLYFSGLTYLYGETSYSYASYYYDSTNDTWVLESSGTYSATKKQFNYSSSNCYWSNFDIYNASGGLQQAAREMKPETVVEETYAPVATDAIYTVTGDTVTNLGATVYQITGQQATTPDKMIAALNHYAALNKPKEETTE